MSAPAHVTVTPRSQLSFDLDGDIPRHWFDGNAFKTRLFDAMSTLFPEGERFFIACVRDYRDQIDDPQLAQQVKDFIFQEAQHGMQHDRYNARLAEQGIAVAVIARQNEDGIRFMRRHMPKSLTLAMTAAAEHLTAIMAHEFLGNRQLFAAADPRLRALFFWHAIEEIEHKAVAYDVMKDVAKVGYFTRILGMIGQTVTFPLFTFMIMNHMFKVDGVKSRWRTWFAGLRWLYGPGGIMIRLLPAYLRYYLPGFHPWKHGRMDAFSRWQSAFADHDGDPVAASETMMAAV